MPGEPNSIKTARRHYLNWKTPLDERALGAELLEGNDRSVVINVAALLDQALQGALAVHLQLPDEAEYLRAFENDGPLSNFSAKIDMAFWLKLIDGTMRSQLHDIRALRNICAHTQLAVSLKESRLANVARRVLHPTGTFKPHPDPEQSIRKAFSAEALLLHATILFGRDEAVRMTRESYIRVGQEPPF